MIKKIINFWKSVIHIFKISKKPSKKEIFKLFTIVIYLMLLFGIFAFAIYLFFLLFLKI